jgi:hypothetical protein
MSQSIRVAAMELPRAILLAAFLYAPHAQSAPARFGTQGRTPARSVMARLRFAGAI